MSFVLGGKLPSFLSDFEGAVPNITKYGLLKKFYSVVSVARLSETTLLFATGEYGHKLMISDGIATMHVNVGNATETYLVCTTSVECGAVHADSAEEAKELNDKAMAALPAQSRRRRLSEEHDCFAPRRDVERVGFTVCGDGENTVCSEAKVILDTCEAAGNRRDGRVLRGGALQPPQCLRPMEGRALPTAARALLRGELRDFPLPPPPPPPPLRAYRSPAAPPPPSPQDDLDVALFSDALSKDDECDNLLAEEAGRLSLPAASCAELRRAARERGV